MASAGANARGRLKITLALTATYMVAEIVGGLWTGSLALLADAAHMGTDVGGLALALFAIWIGQRPVSVEKTFGYYRAEILAALANGVALFGVAFYILFEAYQRFRAPVEIASGGMLAVAAVGLAVNLIGIFLLKAGSKDNLNVKGAYFEVLSDLLSSVGVIVAAGLIALTGRTWIDPLFSVLIGFFILPRTWTLMKEAIDILLEGTPKELTLSEIEAQMRRVPGVLSVHELHVWTITSGRFAASAHVRVAPDADEQATLRELNSLLRARDGFEHITLQMEKGTLDEPRADVDAQGGAA